MVTTLSLDPNAGTLKELDSVSALPPDTKLVSGVPRGAVGTPGATKTHVPRGAGLGSGSEKNHYRYLSECHYSPKCITGAQRALAA